MKKCKPLNRINQNQILIHTEILSNSLKLSQTNSSHGAKTINDYLNKSKIKKLK